MTRAGALISLAGLVLACRPLGPIPGGRLSGQVVGEPVESWAFASATETLQLESRPEDPYSVNVWFVSEGANLWVAAGGGATAKWAKHLAADPRARLGIDGKIYERTAVPVSDQAALEAIVVLYQTKYEYERDPKDESQASVFRMDPR